MPGSYAAVWVHRNRAPHVGSVRVLAEGLQLHDASSGHHDDSVVRFDEIAGVRMGTPAERLADLKTVVVELASGRRVRIAALGVGAGLELAERIAETVSHAV